MMKIKKLFANQTVLLLLAILAAMIGISIAYPPFMKWTNIRNILVQISIYGTIAMGMTVVMISGGLDLSVGAMVSANVALMAVLSGYIDNEWLVCLIGLGASLMMGAINGLIISNSKAEPFIITLGMMYVYKGLSLIICDSRNVYLPTGKYRFFGRTYLFNQMIPVPILVLIAVFLAVFLLLKYTRFGRRVFAIGGNETAAYLSGLHVKRDKLMIYTLLGGITGIASLIMLSRLGVSTPDTGSGLEMNAVAACVIGGISLSGGKGSPVGTFLGFMVLGIVNNSLNLLGVSSFYQYLFLGGVIVVAVVLSNINRK
jgi:ribose/xylose/arabinose/galactoside ABC-type transport system permease subunit